MTKARISRDRLLSAVGIVGDSAGRDDDQVVDALVASGFATLEAELLAALLPLAFGRALLEGVAPIQFSASIGARTRHDRWVYIPLRKLPFYEAALALARESTVTGIVAREIREALAARSGEVGAVRKLLDAGLIGAVTASALARLSAEDLGYGGPWSRLRARLFG